MFFKKRRNTQLGADLRLAKHSIRYLELLVFLARYLIAPDLTDERFSHPQYKDELWIKELIDNTQNSGFGKWRLRWNRRKIQRLAIRRGELFLKVGEAQSEDVTACLTLVDDLVYLLQVEQDIEAFRRSWASKFHDLTDFVYKYGGYGQVELLKMCRTLGNKCSEVIDYKAAVREYGEAMRALIVAYCDAWREIGALKLEFVEISYGKAIADEMANYIEMMPPRLKRDEQIADYKKDFVWKLGRPLRFGSTINPLFTKLLGLRRELSPIHDLCEDSFYYRIMQIDGKRWAKLMSLLPEVEQMEQKHRMAVKALKQKFEGLSE